MGLKEDLKDGVAEQGIYLIYSKDDLVNARRAFYFQPGGENENDTFPLRALVDVIGIEGFILKEPAPFGRWGFFTRIIDDENLVVVRAPSYTGRL